MTTRKSVAVLVFLIPLVLGAMAVGWFSLLPVVEEELEVLSSLDVALMDGLSYLAGIVGLVSSLGGIVGLVAGPLVDWKGSRLLIVTGGLAAALGFLILAAASSQPIALTGGFLASAGVGLVGGIVIKVLVADWFIQYRGTFLGLALLGSGLGIYLFAPAVGLLTELASWRVAAGVLALGGVGVAVAGFTLIHNYPASGEEDDPSKVRVPGRRSPQLERMVPAGQYLRSPGLWRAFGFLALALAGVLWVSSGLSVTARVVLGEELGSNIFILRTLLPIGIVVGGFGWSVAADFWPRNRLLMQSGSAAVVSLVSLAVLFIFSALHATGVGALLFLIGLFLGGLGALIALTFVDYMGVRLLGTLSVAFGLLSGAGRFLGLDAILVEKIGGFQWAILVLVPLVVLAVLAATRAPYPAVELERPLPRS